MDRNRIENVLREFFAASPHGVVGPDLFGSAARGESHGDVLKRAVREQE